MRITLTQTTFNKVISSLGINAAEILKNLELYFNQDFHNRYFPYFKWFKEALPHVESILNPGCGFGRETFALIWDLGAQKTVGIDIDPKKVEYARERVKFINYFRDPAIQSQNWYEEIPDEIRRGNLPDFLDAQDFTLFKPDEYFDLVYCRYFLWGIAEKDQNPLYSVCQKIKDAVRPETGRVVIVEPTKKGDHAYNFVKYLQDVGLTLLTVEKRENRLGRMELDDCKNLEIGLANPEGYILAVGKIG